MILVTIDDQGADWTQTPEQVARQMQFVANSMVQGCTIGAVPPIVTAEPYEPQSELAFADACTR